VWVTVTAQFDVLFKLLNVTKTLKIFVAHFRFFEKATNLFIATGHHACSPSPIKISIDILLPAAKKGWLKISVAYFTKWFQSIFIVGGWRMYPFNLPLSAPAYQRWTLDWIRTIANFVEFGLDPGCKSLQNLGSGSDLDWVNGKEMQHFYCEKAAFFKYFGLHLDLELTFENFLGLWLDLDWVLKNRDWIWIAKFDSPNISAAYMPTYPSRLQWNFCIPNRLVTVVFDFCQ